MDEQILKGVDRLSEQAHAVLRYLSRLERDEPVNRNDLHQASHDAANLAASMRGLRRLIEKQVHPVTD